MLRDAVGAAGSGCTAALLQLELGQVCSERQGRSGRSGWSGRAVTVPVPLSPAGSRDGSPVMRSSSTLPVPHPGSAPPTPTRLTGPNSDTEEEERGDLIQFYNNVYIEQIKEFALKYTSNAVSYILCLSFVNTSCFALRTVFLANLPLSKFKG